MAQKSIQGSKELAGKIRQRRCDLNLTIEDAASRARVGTKTWCRYEAGESIRADKCKGVCKALNWPGIPDCDEENDAQWLSPKELKKHEAWSTFLENSFGTNAATSFAVGSDILLDNIEQDMSELVSLPIGSHIGQLDVSMLVDNLPEQFLMHYDYDFLYQMKCSLCEMRARAKNGVSLTAHSVMQELLIYLCSEEAFALMEVADRFNSNDDKANFNDWVFDLFDDMDIITFLYNGLYLPEDNPYHFSHWSDQQFYMD